jgi:hypothetical protein
MKTLENMFIPPKPNRDFGLLKRRSLNEKEFEFNRIEAYAFVRIDVGTFMLISTYKHYQETFDVTTYFSKADILSVAENVSDVCPELSLFLLDMYQQPFSLETADYLEIDLPYRASIWITLSARLFLEHEDEYKAGGNLFLPFVPTEICQCETEDWLA